MKIVGPDAVKRRQQSAKHMITAFVRPGALQRPEVAHILHDAENR